MEAIKNSQQHIEMRFGRFEDSRENPSVINSKPEVDSKKCKTSKVKMTTWFLLWTIAMVIIVVRVCNGLLPAAEHRTRGVVAGIFYSVRSIENSSAFIDGHIVKEGDTIYGATVVKINRTTVEFEKNEKRWKQRVLERPYRRGWNSGKR